ncbi:hypothetical protein J2847_005992 [Azospirillum agricola]|uniref:hypothetical protein n=1 Tax=Azospirillum agricola TaxID=1720247 RepID=UPI001AE5EAB5|nr:hypothetical protein [Azospirillum agricola]MBP2232661.1 hypothetical protein [Azospirillum agricola]
MPWISPTPGPQPLRAAPPNPQPRPHEDVPNVDGPITDNPDLPDPGGPGTTMPPVPGADLPPSQPTDPDFR